jgi:hypothetical protein
MPRLSSEIWEFVRSEYEAGASQGSLASKFGVTRRAIQKRIEAEGWTQDVTGALARKVAEKVAGVVAGGDPAKRAAAIDAAAERRVAVIEFHKRQWNDHERLVNDAIAKKDFDAARLAKVTAETIAIRQAGERKAWGLDVREGPPAAVTPLEERVKKYAQRQPAPPQPVSEQPAGNVVRIREARE